MSHLNWVDNIILIIFFVSIIAGLMRGLVKEVISLVTWLAAFLVAAMFSLRLATFFTNSSQVQSAVSSANESIGVSTAEPVSMVALGISFIILFVGTLLIGSLINYFLSRAVESQGISFTNRLFGAVFGVARGALFVLAAIFLVQLTSFQEGVAWKESKFVNSFQPAVKWLNDMVEPGLETIKQKMSEKFNNINTEAVQQKAEEMQQKAQEVTNTEE